MNKYSFRVVDPKIIEILESKNKRKEMSAYINNALIFYIENQQQFNNIEQALADIKKMIKNKEFKDDSDINTDASNEYCTKSTDIANEVLMNSVDIF